MSGQRYTENFSLMRAPLFSSWGMDSEILMGVGVGIWAKVFPRVWEHRSDGREPKVWRRGAGGKGFVCRKGMSEGTEGVTGRGAT